MRRLLLSLITITIFMFSISAVAAPFAENVPEWVDGILCISVPGFKESDVNPELDFNQYVAIYDFSQMTLDAALIPSDSYLSSDFQKNNWPMIFFRAKDSDDPRNWRDFGVASLNLDESSESYKEFLYGPPEENAIIPWDGFFYDFDAPLQPLAISDAASTAYHLSYGISEENALEVQFIRESCEEEHIYAHFPLSYDFSLWDYSISENRMAAWKAEGSRSLMVSDGASEMHISIEDMYVGAPCWLNETQLLFTASYVDDTIEQMIYDYLYVWDYTTQETTLLLDASGEPVTIYGSAHTAYASAGGNYVACLHDDGWKSYALRVTFINLNTGEKFSFDPWPELQNDANDSYAYIHSDDGIILKSPAERTMIGFVWMNASDLNAADA